VQRSKDANEDQRVKTPFQNVVMEEEQFEEDNEIHCLEDKGNASLLASIAYPCSFLRASPIKEHVPNLWALFLNDLANWFFKLHGGQLGFFNMKNAGSKISFNSIDGMISGIPFIVDAII